MPASCCALNCPNRGTLGTGVKFYRFPKNPDRRLKWAMALHRVGFTPTDFSRICSAHFVSGRPVHHLKTHVDYVPSIFAFTTTSDKRRAQCALSRVERWIARTISTSHGRKIATKDDAPCATIHFSTDHVPVDIKSEMEENHIETAMCISDDAEKSVGIPDTPTSTPSRHLVTKLPNTPRKPEINEQSSGIFKYIGRDGQTFPITDGVTDFEGSCSNAGGVTFDTIEAVLGNNLDDRSGICSAVKCTSDELSVDLECYNESTHIVCMSQEIQAETLSRKNDGAPKDNAVLRKPTDVGSKVFRAVQETKHSSSKSKDFCRPPKLDQNIGSVASVQSSSFAKFDQFVPKDSDDYAALRSKLNCAVQLYTLQRKQLMQLSGKVKSLTQKNQQLSEQVKASNRNVNCLSPRLAPDTKYILLFENRIQPEAMKIIVNGMANNGQNSRFGCDRTN